MLLRRLIPALVLSFPLHVATATPIDTGHDLLDAVQAHDGDRFLTLLSDGLAARMEEGYLRLKEYAETDPSLTDGMLAGMGVSATAAELSWMSFEDFAGRVLEGVELPDRGSLLSESASMKGRDAEVLFAWADGSSLDLRMVWEDSSWRITGSSLLAAFFR